MPFKQNLAYLLEIAFGEFGEKLKRLVEKTYSSVNLKVAFTAPSDLSKNSWFKDKSLKLKSNR